MMFDLFDLPDLPTPDFDLPGDEIMIADASAMNESIRHDRQVAKRKLIFAEKIRNVEDLLPELPPTDTDVYFLLAGLGAEYKGSLTKRKNVDLGAFLPHLINLFGTSGNIAYLSTWSMHVDQAQNILDLYDSGQLAHITFFSDPSIRGRMPHVAQTIIGGLLDRGQRVKLWRNHAKVILLASPDETKTATLLSSANFSMMPRAENLTLTTAPDVYQFVKEEFFEEMLQRDHRGRKRK